MSNTWAVSRFPAAATIYVAFILLLLPLSLSILQIPPGHGGDTVVVPAVNDAQLKHAVAEMLGDFFIENRGQTTDGVRFYSGGNPAVAFRDDGVMFVWREALQGTVRRGESASGPFDVRDSRPMEPPRAKSHAYLIHFADARPSIPVGRDRTRFNSNFFLGSDPQEWRTDVPNYREVAYQDLYEGIDLAYRIGEGGVKYEFVVHPGADPRVIRLEYEGIDSVRLDGEGIVAHVGSIDVRDSLPYSYQSDGEDVECRFSIKGSASYGFECERWDESRPLIIDPLIFSTFIGGGDVDSGWGVALATDAADNIYVTGHTASANFPVSPGAYDSSQNGDLDVFVAKLGASGTSMIFCTYLGGNGQDSALSIIVDSSNEVYIGGGTSGDGFPVTLPTYDASHNGAEDGFVAKLNAVGNQLMLSTYLGGSDFDRVSAIVLNATGGIHLVGVTGSSDFPTTPGAFSEILGGSNDGFAVKFDAALSTLLYSSYLGGAGEDEAHSLAIDSAGNAYVCGHAGDASFPVTAGAYDSTYNGGNADGFVLKLDSRGQSLLYSTFVGGSGGDDIYGLALESSGAVHVTGKTMSSNYPTTPGAYDRSHNGGGDDAVVTSLNPSGNAAVYSTFVGGNGQDVGGKLILDSTGNGHVTGYTASTDFPITLGAYDTQSNGGGDAFILKINPTGSNLLYSTYIGGTSRDSGDSLRMTSDGGLLAAGSTGSADFPTTPGAYDTTYNGGAADIFIIKLLANNSPEAINLGVQGFMVAPGKMHITDFTPDLNWTYHDVEGDPQTQYEVRVSRMLGGSDMWAPGPQAGAATLVTYAGAPLNRGTDYWFGVRVSDGQWGAWNDTRFHVNSIPTSPPWAADPLDMSSVPASPSQQVTWGPSTDAELDAITYEWQAATDSSFSSIISSGTTAAVSSSPFATSTGETIYWRARARDDYEPTTWSDYGNSPLGYWMFFVLDGPPTAVAYAPFTVGNMNDVMWFDGSNSTDDVGIVSYLWEFGDGATDTSVITSHQYSSRGTYTVNLTVQDTIGQNDTDSLLIDIQNRPPIADAGPDHNAFKRDPVALDGSGSGDPDGDTLAYLWTQTAGPPVTLGNPDTVNPTFTPTFSGTYTFVLNVSDGWGGSSLDSVDVVVVNRPPIAEAGSDRIVAKKSVVILDGSASLDPDMDPLNYSWTQVGGSLIMLWDADTMAPYFTPPASGLYVFQLTVDDGDGGNSTDSVQITATNADPIADAGPDISIRKTLVVVLDGRGSTDPDDDPLAFSWTQLSGLPVTLTNAGSDIATFTATRVGSFTFVLEVGDGDGGVDSDTVAVYVWGLPPVATLAADPQRTFTGFSIRFDGTGSHDPDGVVVNYSFNFDDGTVLEGTAAFRDHVYDVAGIYNVALLVRDDDGNTSIAWAVVVVDPPTIEPNWKPIVALLFSVAIGLLGIWSSRKHPWKCIKTRNAAFKMWIFTAIPFIVAEVATGIVSLSTGFLRIPPILDLGTIVDMIILFTGIGLLAVVGFTGHAVEPDLGPPKRQ